MLSNARAKCFFSKSDVGYPFENQSLFGMWNSIFWCQNIKYNSKNDSLPEASMSSPPGRRLGLLQDLVLIAAANVSIFYIIRYALSRLDNHGEKEEQVNRQSAAAAVLRRLDRPPEEDARGTDGWIARTHKEDLVLNQYEQMIAMDVVAPEDIPVAFDG